MSLNNQESWTNNTWDFDYEIPESESSLPGQLSPVGSPQQGPLEQLGDFGAALFKGILDGLGGLLSGAAEIGGAIFEGVIQGVSDLAKWIGDAIGSVFGRREPAEPLPPVYSSLRTNLEGQIAPFLQDIDDSKVRAEAVREEIDLLQGRVQEELEKVQGDISDADEKITAIGDVDQKIADQAATSLAEVAVALRKADQAISNLADYKKLVDPQIQDALADSRTGLDKLEVLEPKVATVTEDLADYKKLVDPQIQDALADSRTGLDKLEVLEPKVATVISDLEEYERVTNEKIQNLLGTAGSALEDAGTALGQYDELWEEHESFKTDAAEKIAALNTLTGQQQEKINNAVTGSVIEYAVGTSETTAPTSGWSTVTPTRAAGRFTWMRTKVTYGSGQVVTTSAALITGNTGTPGTPGTDGTPGKAGVGLKSTTVTYVTSTSGATAPTTGWTAAVPTLTKGRYLWTKTLWTYTDDSTEIGYSVAYLAKDGSSGTDGLPGKDGTGITGTAITYAKSSSGTSAPTTGWTAQPPSTSPGDFVWTKTVWSYSDNTTETGYTVGKIGNTGAQGVPGAKGTDGKTTYTWIKYADTAAGVGISNDPTGKLYIGFAYNKTTATESSTPSDYTWSLVKGEQGDQGVPGAKGANGQTTYTWIKYSDNANGSGLYDTPKASTKFIGIAVNKTTATESSTASNYAWSQFKGDAGVDGDDGVSITAVTSYYRLVTKGASAPAKPTTVTPSGWSTTEPNFAANRELYRVEKITYSDSTFSYTDVSKVSAYTAANEAMDTAINALDGVFNSTDIGASLVAYIPGTSTPYWAEGMTPAPAEENPDGLKEAYIFSSVPTLRATRRYMSVAPDVEYKVSVWLKADKPGSRIYLEMYNQDSKLAVKSGGIGAGSYPIGNFELPVVWTKYEATMYFNEASPRVTISGRYVNHANGTERNAVQYMADLRMSPVTVTPADVTNTVKVVADSLNSYRTANDTAVGAANKAAQDAAGLAGTKGEVIYQASAPTGTRASKANLWIRTSDNKPHTYNGSAWVAVTDKAATDAAKVAADANALAETKTTTYYQTSAPAASKSVVGDLWIDQSTAGKNTLKRWSGSAWVAVQDKAIAEAMAAAGTAQSTADGKVQTFARAAAPTGMTATDVGDLWIDTDDGNKLYRWSGSAWVSLQDKGIVSALQLAQKGVNDAKAVADKIPTLDSRLETLSTDQGTLGTKAQQGIDDAKYAADLVRNSVDIGTSLVALIPGTNRPRWSQGIEEVAVTDLPGVTTAYKASSTQQTTSPSVQWVKADPKVKYHVSFWAKASAPGSRFYIYFDNQDEVRALISNTLPGGSTNLLDNFQFPTKWTKYEGVIQLRDTTERVRFRSMFWNHSNGIKVDQFIADLRIEPVIPSQDDVNKLLIDTAENHTGILKAQAEINDIHAGKWKDQSALNTLQLEIDENQNTAIQGLTASTMLAFPHMNVAPEDSTGRPWWSIGMSVNPTFTPPGAPVGESYWTSSSNIINVDPEAMITVVPGIDYKLEFWTARVDTGTAGAFVDVRNESGGVVLTHWVDVTDGIPPEISWSARGYAGGYLPTSTNWERKVYLLRVRPGTNKVALHFRPGGTATANGTRVRFWGAHLSAFMPIQEQLDAAQTGAILALDSINDSQDGLIAANNKAINAAKDATAANTRILNMVFPAQSAVPMVPGGVRNGGTDAKPVFENMPAWLEACTRVTTGLPTGVNVSAYHTGSYAVKEASHKNRVQVDPNIEYKYSAWVKASKLSDMNVGFRDQDNAYAVKSTEADPGSLVHHSNTSDLFWVKNIPSGWKQISGTVTFHDKVREVFIDKVSFNHTSGTNTDAAQWLADIQITPNMPAQSDVNKALADVNAAQTAILSGHQDVLDMAFPNTSLVPMINGVPEWASTVGANPIRTPEGNWRFTSATAIQPGTGGGHVPTANGIVYRAIARVRRTESAGTFYIRLRKAGGAANVALTAVTGKPAVSGATRTNFITSHGSVSSAVNVWETWYYDFTLANNTGDVRIGYVNGSVGVEVSQLSVVALLPDQSEYNRVNNEINSTQNDVLHDHQRVLDLMNPPETVVAMYPGGYNIGTDVKPEYVEFPYWLRDSGSYSTYGDGSLPDGNRVAVTKTTTTTPTINGHYVPVTPGGEYRYEFYFKASAANSGLVIYMTDDKGSAAFQSGGPDNPAYGNTSGHLWWSPNMPGGTGPDGNGFYRITGKLKVRDDVTRARISRIYYNWSSGSVTTSQTITGLRIWPDVPSQQQVDEIQNEAISALERTIRLAFPDINMLPSSEGNIDFQYWHSGSSWVTRYGTAATLPPADKRLSTLTYQVMGTGTQTRSDFARIELPPEVRQFRIRARVRSANGFFPSLRLVNSAHSSIITRWRETAPNEELALAETISDLWINSTAAGGHPTLAENATDWVDMDIVVEVASGAEEAWITLSSPGALIADAIFVHGLRMSVFYPSQAEVDFAQNRALAGLKSAVALQDDIDTKFGEVEKESERQLDSIRKIQAASEEMIMRSMVMDLGSNVVSFHDKDGVFFNVLNNSNNVIIEAVGGNEGWVGQAILTYSYGASHETDYVQFDIPNGTSRSFTATTQSRQWRRKARLDWWVEKKEQISEPKMESPGIPVALGWTTRTNLTFKAKASGLHLFDYRVVWPNTSRNDKYWGIRARKGSTVIQELVRKNIGPNFPWESGRRSQSFSGSVDLKVNETITFEVYTGADSGTMTAAQRTLDIAERTVSWMQDKKA